MSSREVRNRPAAPADAGRAARSPLAPLVAGVALAAGLGGYFYATANGPAPQSVTPTPAAAAGSCACANDAGAATSAALVPAQRPEPGAAEIEAQRFRVCPREEAPARLARLALDARKPALWALHCGSSVQLLALRELSGRVVPERLALIDLPTPGPAETHAAAETAAADVDGDGRADLLVPSLLIDRSSAPSGGAVLLLRQRAQGGLHPPVRLLEAAPSAIAALGRGADKGQELAVLQRQDGANARSDELWLVQGGPSPQRRARLVAGVGASALAALDLDLDGADDLAVGSAREGKLRLFLSRRGAHSHTAPLELAVAGILRGRVAELDGDGQRDLLLETETGAVALLARAEINPQPPLVTESAGLRDIDVMDVNADGKPDLLGYSHPEIALLLQGTDFSFQRTALASVRGEGAILQLAIASLDANPRPDAVIVALSENHVELAIALNLQPGSTVRLDRAEPLLDAAWLEHFTSL